MDIVLCLLSGRTNIAITALTGKEVWEAGNISILKHLINPILIPDQTKSQQQKKPHHPAILEAALMEKKRNTAIAQTIFFFRNNVSLV